MISIFFNTLKLILAFDDNKLASRPKSCFIRSGYATHYSNGTTSFSFSDKNVITAFLLEKGPVMVQYRL